MWKSVVVVLFASVLGGVVTATGQSQLVEADLVSGPGGGFGDLYLLAQTAVQEDLRLTEPQKEQVRELIGDLIRRQQSYRRGGGPGNQEQQAQELVRLRQRYDQLAVSRLTPTQTERLRQISLRVKNTASFWDASVRSKLGITDEQFNRMKTLATKTYSTWNQEVEAEFHKNKDYPEYQRKLEETRKRRDREQLAILTPEQRAKWERMIGEPFDGPIPSPILIRAATAQAPAPPRVPQLQTGDPTEKLAGVVGTLAQEVARLNQENRRLQQENDRLRAELDQLRSRTSKPPKVERFIDRDDHVEDTKTGLLWQKDGTASGKLNYFDALKYATTLKLGGHYGWRVPTRDELAAIFPATDEPFTNTMYNKSAYGKGAGEWNSYWTADLDRRLPDYAYVYQWYDKGGANNCIASGNFVYVRCVHDPIRK